MHPTPRDADTAGSNTSGAAIEGVLETCLYAEDLDAIEPFYRDLLGLMLVTRESDRHRFFRCGNQMLLVFNPAATSDPGGKLPPHGARGSGHVAFEVRGEAAMRAWRDRLDERGVPIEAEMNWSGRGHSIYVRDPAGNSVELALRSMWPLP